MVDENQAVDLKHEKHRSDEQDEIVKPPLEKHAIVDQDLYPDKEDTGKRHPADSADVVVEVGLFPRSVDGMSEDFSEAPDGHRDQEECQYLIGPRSIVAYEHNYGECRVDRKHEEM